MHREYVDSNEYIFYYSVSVEFINWNTGHLRSGWKAEQHNFLSWIKNIVSMSFLISYHGVRNTGEDHAGEGRKWTTHSHCLFK